MPGWCTFSLGSYFEQAGDEHHLIENISFANTIFLVLSDHVHRFMFRSRVKKYLTERLPVSIATASATTRKNSVLREGRQNYGSSVHLPGHDSRGWLYATSDAWHSWICGWAARTSEYVFR
jgi:hypothetical protein